MPGFDASGPRGHQRPARRRRGAGIDKKRKALGIDKARERVLFDMDMRRETAEAAAAGEEH